jgi:hypothetical protein
LTTWREQLAWAAGLFDGEGSIYNHEKEPTRAAIKLHVGQKDRRVLDRFLVAVGIGKVYGPHKTGTHCEMYGYLVNSHEDVQAVIAMLWSWLGPVKRAQASTAFLLAAKARALKAESLRFCAHGHEFTAQNTRVYEWHGKRSRFCRMCGRIRYARRRSVIIAGTRAG